jgi:hypothetical protein
MHNVNPRQMTWACLGLDRVTPCPLQEHNGGSCSAKQCCKHRGCLPGNQHGLLQHSISPVSALLTFPSCVRRPCLGHRSRGVQKPPKTRNAPLHLRFYSFERRAFGLKSRENKTTGPVPPSNKQRCDRPRRRSLEPSAVQCSSLERKARCGPVGRPVPGLWGASQCCAWIPPTPSPPLLLSGPRRCL